MIMQQTLRDVSLVPYVDMLEDSTRTLDFNAADVAFANGGGHAMPGDNINIGFSSSSFWFRFGLVNAWSKPRTVFVQIDFAILDRVDLYCGRPGEKPTFFQLGDHVQFESRPVAVRNFAVPLEFQAGDTQICTLRVESTSNIAVPITVSDVVPFVEDTRAGDWLLGWFYGLAFGLFVYNLLVYFATRERVYLLYVLHVMGGWGYNSALDGSFSMLWTLLDVQDASVVFFICLSLASVLLFAQDYLGVREGHPRVRLGGNIVLWLIGLVLVAIIVMPLAIVTQLSVYVSLVTAVYIWLLGLWRLRQGGRDIWAFVLGFGAVMVVASFALLSALGLAIPMFLATYGMKLAWVFELAALSFGLGLRIQGMKAHQRGQELEMVETRAESRAKTEFLAKVSHEIRTPMNGILGLAELLGMTRLSAEQGRYVSAINSAGRALVDVVNDILDYSKLAVGKMTLSERFFDMRELLEDCAAIFEMPARKKELDLRIIIRQGTPLRIKGDASRLRQVVLNLLSNAMKYTEFGHVFIRLSLTDEIRDERVVVKLSVEDSGIGIDREDQSRLFQSFTQIPSDVTDRETGTGLGLAISQQLIDLMGGKMGVESMLGHGSSFWFTLPVSLEEDVECAERDIVIDVYRPGMGFNEELPSAVGISSVSQLASVKASVATHPVDTIGAVYSPVPAPEADVSPPVSLAQTSTSSSLDLQVRVLLAEDNLINQKVILGFLDRLGIRPDIVENGRAALEKVTQAPVPYDLIFLDCQMPVMDGYEASRRIRDWEKQKRRPRTPIVALSAHHSDFHVQQSERAGMNLHLSKPLSFKSLSDAVTHALGLGSGNGS